ncbi:MAG: LysE family translocator [Cyanobacteria bacterium J06638_22]
MISPEFLLAALIVVLIPGIGALYTVSTGLLYGQRASVAAALGCTAGVVPHLLLSIVGLSLLWQMNAIAFQFLKFAGTGYLIYVAWAMGSSKGVSLDLALPQQNLWKIARKAVWLNLLNPQLTTFLLAFLPLFIPTDVSFPIIGLLGLGGVFMAITFAVFAAYGLLASRFRKRVAGSPHLILWTRRLFAVLFAILAVQLAVATP